MLRASASPRAGDGAVGELDQVERVLDVGIDLSSGTSSFELNWHAMPQLRIGSGSAPMSSASWKYSKKPSPNDW